MNTQFNPHHKEVVMMTFNIKREWISLAAIVGIALLSVIFYPALPDVIPIHWDVNGQPDNFAPKLQALTLVPVGALLLYGILYFAPLLDPKRANLERSADTYRLIRTVVMLFFLFIHAATIYATLQGNQMLDTAWMTVAMGVLFIILGNYMPRMKPSWIAGIRTPWTLSSDTVWIKTHRIGGWAFVISGLIICLTAFLPPTISTGMMVVAIAGAIIVPIAYSYMIWQREAKKI
jgi:uncharacterized membrane protein